MSRRISVQFVLLAILLLVVGLVVSSQLPSSNVDDVKNAVRGRRYHEAVQLADRLLESGSTDPDLLLHAAIAHAELGEFDLAVRLCLQVSDQHEKAFVDARCMAGGLFLNQLYVLSEGEKAYRSALTIDPNNLNALMGLSRVLSIQTKTSELREVNQRIIRLGNISLSILLPLIQPDLLYPDRSLIERLLKNEPQHPGLLLAQSRLSAINHDWQAVEDFATQAISVDPQLIEARSRLGQSLFEQGNHQALALWWQNLPDDVLDVPESWLTLGKLCQMRKDDDASVRCFWEAGKRNGASTEANHLLGLQLLKLGHQKHAERFLQQAQRLEKYQKFLDFEVNSETRLTNAELKEQCEQAHLLGLFNEAYALSMLAVETYADSEWATQTMNNLRPQVDEYRGRMIADKNPFLKLDLSQFPLPSKKMLFAETELTTAGAFEGQSAEFVNIAERTGLRFTYDNGVDDSISGAQRPYDFVGGGAAVLDLDMDGWPDLYLPQGCQLRNQSGEPVEGDCDQFFRNMSGTRFRRMTKSCLPITVDYSAGSAAGDVNSDGFPDLFVANLGRNRLLQNNGDGTYSDISSSVQNDASRWTTSCLIADLNQDGHPDLYSVNYLAGDITSRVCRDSTGRKESCAPQDFPASQDQLHLNDGTGAFFDATKTSGVEVPYGKGLGIVAADLNEDRRLDLFIANDGVPNFFFERQNDATPQLFIEKASVAGLAVNGTGKSEACMGVVVEDLDLDHSTELFVTNFWDETNTLYSNSSIPGLFEDITLKTDLGATSRNLLSFGVQAIDSNLDGLPDLVIANGHVDNFLDRGVPYQMKPQYFHNQGHLGFREQRFDEDDTFFTEEALGRCVAKIDWNRDGSEDVVVTRLQRPVALLQNNTTPRGHFIGVKLVGITGSRDALGAMVSVKTESNHSLQRQRTGGDGYLASNDPILIFGLAESDGDVEIEVQWPQGENQTFHDLQVDRFYTIIQGNPRAMNTCSFEF